MTNQKIKIIYLLGSGHCGSTLLDLIMDCHSKIVGVGELENLPLDIKKQQQNRCACGEKINKCIVWSSILERINIETITSLKVYQPKFYFLFDRKNFFSIDKKGNKLQSVGGYSYLTLNKKIYQEIKKISGKEIIFDSSKRPDRLELLNHDSTFDIIIIHLVRDGRGVAYSYYRKYGGFLRAVLRWALTNIKIEIFKRKHKNLSQLLVRYEDLTRQPEQTLKRILSWLELDYEPQMLNFRSLTHHQVAGNRLRLENSSEIQEDLSWRENLSKKQLIVFQLLFGWLNKFYGY